MCRTTFLIGAGIPLDLSLSDKLVFPSTANITAEVCKPYCNYKNEDQPIQIVQDIYDRLMEVYPPKENPFSSESPKPYIHFEHLFHVLEMLDSYHWVWRGNCKNEAISPVFAPFTKSDFDFDGSVLHIVIMKGKFIEDVDNIHIDCTKRVSPDFCDGTRMSPKGYMVMTCNDIGVPLSAGVSGRSHGI